jgi:hypothetical protein
MKKNHWFQSCLLALHLACFSTLTMAQTAADPKQPTSATIPASESSKPAVPEKASTTPASTDISLERQAYRIEIRFSVAENVALDSSTANQCLIDLKSLSDRVVGQPWNLQTRWAEGETWDADFDLWQQWPEPIEYDRKTRFPFDKIWLIRARPGSDTTSLELIGREFDYRTGILGPVRRRSASLNDLPRGLIHVSKDIFRPLAEVIGNEGGQVRLRVQGSGLKSASPEGATVRPGQYFQLVRLFYERSGKFIASSVEPWTYLKAATPDDSGVSCQIISSFRDPVGRKYKQANKLVALAYNPSDTATQLQFSQLIQSNGASVKHPVAGYKVEIHRWPDGEVASTHLTDREGKLTIDPPVGLEFFGVRLVGGSIEPLLDVPILAGDQVPAILADTKPSAVEFEQKLIAFRDEILDGIARRLIIEARIADRTKAEDWDSVDGLLRAWKATPQGSAYSAKVSEWKVSAQKRQIQEKKAIYTQAAQALTAEIEALASRYEGHEIEIFEESLQKRSSSPYLRELADREPGKAKPKSTASEKAVPKAN